MPIPKSVLIISSLLTSVCGQPFAIPQDAVVRLFHLGASQQRDMIASLPGGRVLRAGGEVIQLLDLAELLGLTPSAASGNKDELRIVTLRFRDQTFGLIVDEIIDSEEIVVKPIGGHLAPLGVYGGATFLGDGTVGLILDVEGVARRGLISGQEAPADARSSAELATNLHDREYLLVNLQHPGLFAIPTGDIYRIEECQDVTLQFSGDQPVMVYRGAIMPLFSLGTMLGFAVAPLLAGGKLGQVVVTQQQSRFFGFAVDRVIDIARSDSDLDGTLADRVGLKGNVFFGESAGNVVNLCAMLVAKGLLSDEPEEPTSEDFAPAESSAVDAPTLEPKKPEQPGGEAGWGLF